VKRARFLALGIAAALTLAACGEDTATDEPAAEETSAAAPEPADIRLWLNGPDTPQEIRDWLKTEFEKENPGSTLTIEEQEWEGLVERLTTSLGSEEETPDVVEIGNTQAATFTTVGAFTDLTDKLDELGGDDLIPSFVEAGTADGKTSAVPYYAGSAYVFYRKDLFEKSGLQVPTTMQEFIDAAIKLKQDNASTPNFSGFWLPGQDWRDGQAFIWDAGGDWAEQDGDEWKGTLSSPESIEGLKTVQKLFNEASGAPKDGNEAAPEVPFCAGEIGMMLRPGWVRWSIDNADIGCPDLAPQLGVFPLPGSDGEPAPVLLGGSNIAISAKSQHQELAYNLVKLMLSDEYQTQMAKAGLTPAKLSLAPQLGTDEFAQAAVVAASNAKLTPAAANWAAVEGSRVLEDLFVDIANGGDVQQLAEDADAKITEQLN
jgi:ABC-type glycerol-3-phosphate transport system substrate-binding protein